MLNLGPKNWKKVSLELIGEIKAKKSLKPKESESTNASSSNGVIAEPTNARQEKIKAHIKKLEKRLRAIEKKIRELDECSDWSDVDEDDSPYIQVDRYKRKAVKIHKEIQKLRNESDSLTRHQVQYLPENI